MQNKQLNTQRILLILGGIFIILAGMIFATTSWSNLANESKVFIFGLATALFFSFSELSEKKLGLEKTGNLFFNIAVVFLPILTFSIAYFKILGEYFSLTHPTGLYLVLLAMALSATICSCIGCHKYGYQAYGYILCISISAIVITFLLYLGFRNEFLALASSIFTLVVVLSEKFVYSILGKDNIISKIYKTYILINTGVLGILILFTASTGVISSTALIIYSAIFLTHSLNPFNKGEGAYSFSIFMLIAMIKLIGPNGVNTFSLCIIAVITTMISLNILCLLDDSIKKVMSKIINISSIIVSVLLFIELIFVNTWNYTMLFTLALMVINSLVVGVRDNNKTMLSVHSTLIIALLIGTLRFLSLGFDISCQLFGFLLTLVYILYYTQKRVPLLTTAVNVIYPVAILIISLLSLDNLIIISGLVSSSFIMYLCSKQNNTLSKLYSYAYPIIAIFIITNVWSILYKNGLRVDENDFTHCFLYVITAFVYIITGKKALRSTGLFILAVSSFMLAMHSYNCDIVYIMVAIAICTVAYILTSSKKLICILPAFGISYCLMYSLSEYLSPESAIVFTSIAIIACKLFKANRFNALTVSLIIASFLQLITTLHPFFYLMILIGTILALFASKHNKLMILLAVIAYSFAWQVQPFYSIPVIISTEIMLLPSVIISAFIFALYKDKRDITEYIIYAIAVSDMFWLSLKAVSRGYLLNVIILMIISVVMITIAHIIKKLRWFVLPTVVLIGIGIYASQNFWSSIAWWVYILLTGIILISLGIYDEWKKKNTDIIGNTLRTWYNNWRW